MLISPADKFQFGQNHHESQTQSRKTGAIVPNGASYNTNDCLLKLQ